MHHFLFITQLDKNASLPVMIWIHGGGFLIGSGSIYKPDYIMDKSVVLVTFNYRLGALGLHQFSIFLVFFHKFLIKSLFFKRIFVQWRRKLTWKLWDERSGQGSPVGSSEYQRVRRKPQSGNSGWTERWWCVRALAYVLSPQPR